MKTIKKILGTFLLVFASVIVFSQTSQFTIRSKDNKDFKLIFDNEVYKNSNFYTIRNIHKGNHQIKIFSVKNHHGNKPRHYGHSGYSEKLILRTNIFIDRFEDVEAIIDHQNRLKVISRVSLNTGGHGNHGNTGNNGNTGHNGYGQGNHGNTGYNGYGQGNHGNTGYNGYGQGNNGNTLNNQEFRNLENTIASRSFDSAKLDVAKMALDRNWITSQQVLEICSMFAFENSRLDFAKFAYPKTIDKENYFLVNNSFTFNSTGTELYRYINSFGR